MDPLLLRSEPAGDRPRLGVGGEVESLPGSNIALRLRTPPLLFRLVDMSDSESDCRAFELGSNNRLSGRIASASKDGRRGRMLSNLVWRGRVGGLMTQFMLGDSRALVHDLWKVPQL